MKALVAEGTISQHVARAYAVDPSTLDDVRVRPRDFDAEAWTTHADSWQLSRGQ